MVSQVKGLAQAVGLPYVLHTAPLRRPWKSMLIGCIPATRWIFQQPELFDADPPRLLITCGRQAVMSALYLKKRHGRRVFTVHIQDPRITPRRFDLIVSPEHDRLLGPNVVQSVGALHHITRQVLDEAARIGLAGGLPLPPPPFVTVLLGGPNRYYDFSDADMQRLEHKLVRLVRDEAIRLAILPSRRTPEAALQRFRTRFLPENSVWCRDGDNPYLAALALGTHIIVTSDSASMISEAAATGKPIYVEYLTERRYARRFRRLHDSFQRLGITRPFEGALSDWTYDVPNDTAAVGQRIRNRLESSPCHC